MSDISHTESPSQILFYRTSGVRFVRVASAGDLAKERVVLRATADINVINLVLVGMNQGDDPSEVTDLNRDLFWFPDYAVKRDDYILLYTKAGHPRNYISPRGSTMHAFYWDKDHPVWTGETNIVGILRVRGWHFYPIDPEIQEED